MTNLRDWQKKASKKKERLAVEWCKEHQYTPMSVADRGTSFGDGYSSRDAEIDLLLQIIEKQSEAVSYYKSRCRPCNSHYAEHEEGFKNDNLYGCDCLIARTAQAEVQGLVKKLTGEK